MQNTEPTSLIDLEKQSGISLSPRQVNLLSLAPLGESGGLCCSLPRLKLLPPQDLPAAPVAQLHQLTSQLLILEGQGTPRGESGTGAAGRQPKPESHPPPHL